MKVIVYKSKHGSTKKVAKIMNEYLKDCLFMNVEELDYQTLEMAEIIIVGTPVYYRRLDIDIVNFIKNNQELLIKKNYCLYIVGIQSSEFMTFVTHSFDYSILKGIKVIAGVGGIIYFPNLSVSEKMIIQIMNKRSPIIVKQKNKDIFQNINDEEIKIFTNKIKKIVQN